MGKKDELYEKALIGKKIPVLTLDNKWYKLFPNLNDHPHILELARELNDLLKRQGKLNTETKEIKNIKMRLMQEIVPMVDELAQKPDKSLEKKLEDTNEAWSKRYKERFFSGGRVNAFSDAEEDKEAEQEARAEEIRIDDLFFLYGNTIRRCRLQVVQFFVHFLLHVTGNPFL